MIVAGVGCRRGTAAAEIGAAISAALERCGLAPGALTLIATSSAKGAGPGIQGAASALGLPMVLVEQRALEDAGERTATRSQRVFLRTGVPSLAEAAALAAAGPAARLIVQRVAVGGATCALAQSPQLAGSAA